MSDKPYHHGDLRQALVQAAITLVTEGDAAPSLREVARRAGVSHTAPYRHFTDKEALLAAVAEDAYRGLTASMRDHVAKAYTSVDQFTASGKGYIAYALTHPAQFRLMFGPNLPPVAAHAGLQQAADEAFGLLVALIERGQAEGQLSRRPPRELALASWSLAHGFAQLILDQRVGVAAEHVDSLTDALLAVLREGVVNGA